MNLVKLIPFCSLSHCKQSFLLDPLIYTYFRAKFEESKQITLAAMDAGGKKKSGKGDFDNAIKGNEEIRNMKFHHMTFDDLEDALETNINDSK